MRTESATNAFDQSIDMPTVFGHMSRDSKLSRTDADTRLLQTKTSWRNLPHTRVCRALHQGSERHPANANWSDIELFRVRRLWPHPEDGWRVVTPQRWAEALVRIRGWQPKRFEASEAVNDDRFWMRLRQSSRTLA